MKTSRSRQVGSSFSMPMTVMSTSGSVRHIRPLPSDSRTTTVPVSATAKFAPETATRARRNFSRRWRRAASASSGGASVRPAGAGRPTRPISSMKMSRISVRLLVDRRDEDVRRQVVPELDDHLGEVGLPDVDPLLAERLVELDLLGRHRLDLDDLGRAVVMDDRCDDRVRLGGVARPVDGAAGRGDGRLELHEERGQIAHDLVLDRRPGEPEVLPVGPLGDGRGALRPDRVGRPAEVRPELLVRERGPRGLRGRAGSPRRSARAPGGGAATRRGSSCPALGRGQDLGEMHDPDRRAAP